MAAVRVIKLGNTIPPLPASLAGAKAEFAFFIVIDKV